METFRGAIQRVIPKLAFMESAPGVCDVCIHANALEDPASHLHVGDEVICTAEPYEHGRNRYRAILCVVERRAGQAPPSPKRPPPQAHPTEPEQREAQADVPTEDGDVVHRVEGKVDAVGETYVVISSPLGDVYLGALSWNQTAISIGDNLSVLAMRVGDGEERGAAASALHGYEYEAIEVVGMTQIESWSRALRKQPQRPAQAAETQRARSKESPLTGEEVERGCRMITGKVTSTGGGQHGGFIFMESSPGVSNVYVASKVCGPIANYKVGQTVSVVAEVWKTSTGDWRGVRMLNEACKAGALLLKPSSRLPQAAGAAGAAAAGAQPPSGRAAPPSAQSKGEPPTLPLLEQIASIALDLLGDGGRTSVHAGQLCHALYKARPGADKEIKAVGGLSVLCEGSELLRYVPNGSGGEVQLAAGGCDVDARSEASASSAAPPLPAQAAVQPDIRALEKALTKVVLDLDEEYGAIGDSTISREMLMSAIHIKRPGAEEEIAAAGGLCALFEKSTMLSSANKAIGGKVRLEEAAEVIRETAADSGATGRDMSKLHDIHCKLVSVFVSILEQASGFTPPILATRLCEVLYREHSDAKSELKAAGGLRTICEASDVLVYVEDQGGGKVKLRADGDVFLVTGRVSNVRESCAFMESRPGKNDVYIHRKTTCWMGRLLKEGEAVTVLATLVGKQFKAFWVLEVNCSTQGVCRVTRWKNEVLHAPAPVSSGKGLGAATRSSWSGADHEETLVQDVVCIVSEWCSSQADGPAKGMIGSAVCIALYKQRPEAKDELAKAGGLKALCGRYSSVLSFVPDGGPGWVSLKRGLPVETGNEAPHQDQGRVVSSHIVDIIRRNAADRCQLSCTEACDTLFREAPEAKRVIKEAGGMRHFCSAHADELTWIEGDMVKVVVRSTTMTGCVSYATERAYVLKTPSQQTIKVGKELLPPGVKLLKQGDTLTVQAVPQMSGNCDFKATSLDLPPKALPVHQQTNVQALGAKGGDSGFEVMGDAGHYAAGRVANLEATPIRVSNPFEGLQDDEEPQKACSKRRALRGRILEPLASGLVRESSAQEKEADMRGLAQGATLLGESLTHSLRLPPDEPKYPVVVDLVGTTAVMKARVDDFRLVGVDTLSDFKWREDGPPADGHVVTLLAMLKDDSYSAFREVSEVEAQLWVALMRQHLSKASPFGKCKSVIDFAKEQAETQHMRKPKSLKDAARSLISFVLRTCVATGDCDLLAHVTRLPTGIEDWTLQAVNQWLEMEWVGFANDASWVLEVLDIDESRGRLLAGAPQCFANVLLDSIVDVVNALLRRGKRATDKRLAADFAFLARFASQILSVPATSSQPKIRYSLSAVEQLANLTEETGLFTGSRPNCLAIAARAARYDLVTFLAEIPSILPDLWSEALHAVCTETGGFDGDGMTDVTREKIDASMHNIITLLVQRAGDKVLVREWSGKLLFNLAAESGLRQELCRIVLPPHEKVLKAMNLALDRDPPLIGVEVAELVEMVPRGDIFKVKLECLIDKEVSRDAGAGTTCSSSGLLDFLLQKADCVDNTAVRPDIFRLLQHAIDKHSWKASEVLLKNIPGQTLEGSEILIHEAAAAGNVPILAKLLKYGADCNLTDSKAGQTPLHRACTAKPSDVREVFKCLLDGGADAQIKDWKQRTPKDFLLKAGACSAPNTVKDVLSKILDRKASRRATVAHVSSPQKASSDGAQPQRTLVENDVKATAEMPHTRAVTVSQGGNEHSRPVATGVKERKMAIKEQELLTETDLVIGIHEKICVYSEIVHRRREGIVPTQELPSGVVDMAPMSPQIAPATPLPAAQPNLHAGADAAIVAAEAAAVEAPAAIGVAEPMDELVVDLSAAEWDLRFTRNFKMQLFALHSQPNLQRSIIKRLGQLAAGEQGKSLMKKLKGGNLGTVSLNIFESPVKTFNDGPRFLWQYAVDYSPRIGQFADTIRLWMIVLDHDDVKKGMDYIVESHRRGRTSIMRRMLKPCSGGSFIADGRRIPRTYSPGDGDPQSILEKEEIQFKSLLEHREESDDDQPEEEEAGGVVIFTPPAVSSQDSYNVLKFYSLSNEVVHSVAIRSGAATSSRDAAASHLMPEFPFIPDAREHTIITSTRKSPILLVGRSGTGKTSIAVGRMWEMYRRWHVSFGRAQGVAAGGDEEEVHSYNQIFVTANTVLRDQVRKSFCGMKEGFLGADAGNILRESDYPPTFASVPSSMFPLFLTQNEFLRMLDGTLDEPFFPRNADGSMKYQIEGLHEEEGALDSLPGEYDGFLFEDDEEEQHSDSDDGAAGGTGNRISRWSRLEVDFALFEREIWPKIAASRGSETKDLSAAALWTEITSYIKGSYVALDTARGFLLKEEYLRLPRKMAPTFDGIQQNESVDDVRGDKRGTKDLIYDLFVMYEDIKKKAGYYDISDVCFHIYTRLLKTPYSGVPLQSMFIDETQDFTQAELRIFIEVCACKTDMFFSGDTCQTISSGVGFRFEDLKVLFQKVKAAQRPGSLQAIEVPDVQSMAVNYRTHNGILSLAASLVDLLEEFFPQTLDKLDRESGYFGGPKPILLTETSPESATIMIVGSNKEDSQIEFGASQVILVRNQEAKSRLPEEFDGCLAMTVLEAKGLEFDTVFIWDFFGDSRADEEWRLALTSLCGNKETEVSALSDAFEKASGHQDVRRMLRTVNFNPHTHQRFCDELKHLYTAVTRARVRVVIFDSNAGRRAPMFHFLKQKGLVQCLEHVDDDTIAPMIEASNSEKWREQGFNLQENQIYELAAKCFRNAHLREMQEERETPFIPSNLQLESECHAQHLCRKASEEKDGSKQKSKIFLQAADKFLEAGIGRQAAKCLYSSGKFDLAGKLYQKLIGIEPDDERLHARFSIKCFLSMKNAEGVSMAIEVMKTRKMLKSAFSFLCQFEYYEQASKLLDEHPDFVPPPDAMSLDKLLKLTAQNLVGVEGKGARERFMAAVERMESPEDVSHYMSLRSDTKDELVNWLLKQGRHLQAARALAYSGRVDEAAGLLEKLEQPNAEERTLAVDLRVHFALSEACESKTDDLNRALRTCTRPSKRCDDATATESEGASEADGDAGMTLRSLGIRLQIARRTASAAERSSLLTSLQDACDHSVACKALFSHEALLAQLATLQASEGAAQEVGEVSNFARATTDHQLEGARDIVRMLDSAIADIDNGNLLRVEQFMGVVRSDGLPCMSRWGKEFMDSVLTGVSSFPRGEQFVVDQRSFASCLRKKFTMSMLDSLILAHTSLDHLFKTADGDEALRLAVLRVWAVERHTKVLSLPEMTEMKEVRAGSEQGRHGEKALEVECMRVMEMVCPTLERDPVAQLSAVFPEGSDWSDEAAMARKTILQATQRMVTNILNGSFDRTTPKTLSIAITTLEVMGCESRDVDSILNRMCRHMSYRNLRDAFKMRRSGDFLSECSFYVRYIHKCIIQGRRDPPVNLLNMLQSSLAEIMVALAFPAKSTDLGLTALEVAKRANDGKESIDAYLPRSIASRFEAIDPSSPPSRLPGERRFMWDMLRDFLIVLRRVVEGQPSQFVKDRALVMMWTVFVNILAHVNTAVDDGPATKRYGTNWSSEWLADVSRIGSYAVVPGGGGLALLQKGGPLLVMRPSHLHALLAAKGDSLVRVNGSATVGSTCILSVDERPDLEALDSAVVASAARSCKKVAGAASSHADGATLEHFALDPLASAFLPSAMEDAVGEDEDDQAANAAARQEARERAVEVLQSAMRRNLTMRERLRQEEEEAELDKEAAEELSSYATHGGGAGPALQPNVGTVPQQMDWDPYQRRHRYAMFRIVPCLDPSLAVLQHQDIVNIHVLDMNNLPIVLARSNHPSFSVMWQQIQKAYALYHSQSLPALLEADAAMFQLLQLQENGNGGFAPLEAVELRETLNSLNVSMQNVEAAHSRLDATFFHDNGMSACHAAASFLRASLPSVWGVVRKLGDVLRQQQQRAQHRMMQLRREEERSRAQQHQQHQHEHEHQPFTDQQDKGEESAAATNAVVGELARILLGDDPPTAPAPASAPVPPPASGASMAHSHGSGPHHHQLDNGLLPTPPLVMVEEALLGQVEGDDMAWSPTTEASVQRPVRRNGRGRGGGYRNGYRRRGGGGGGGPGRGAGRS